MKKTLLAAALVTMGLVSAQETKFGVKAGYSMSTLKVSEDQDDLEKRSTDPSHTFYIGGLVQHKFSDKFGIQGELLYSPLGGKEKIEREEEGVWFGLKNKVELGTLLIPVSAKYFINDSFAVSAGASFGLILSAKQKTTLDTGFPGLELEGDDTVDIKDDVNTLNIAPFVGAEYTLENGFFFDARYNYGISNLNKDGGSGKITNSFLQVGVGFKFGGN